MIRILLVVAISSLAFSCAPNDGTLAPSPAALVSTQWTLVNIGGQPVTGALRRPTLTFAAEAQRASGFLGCNQFTASYTITGDQLRFNSIAATRMFCAESMDLEDRYAAALEATRGYRTSGTELELTGESGLIARFERR